MEVKKTLLFNPVSVECVGTHEYKVAFEQGNGTVCHTFNFSADEPGLDFTNDFYWSMGTDMRTPRPLFDSICNLHRARQASIGVSPISLVSVDSNKYAITFDDKDKTSFECQIKDDGNVHWNDDFNRFFTESLKSTEFLSSAVKHFHKAKQGES